VLYTTLSGAAATLKGDGFDNIPYLYGCYGSSEIGDVVSQSPGAGGSYGSTQPVSLKLQANNC
jgi:serine/threonine-protein kinase